MDRIIVENVRCFHSRLEIPLTRITVLVGENSSGKSTFLAITRLAWGVISGAFPLDFNEEPFQLGAYEQIATFRGGRGGRAKEFTIGALLRRSKAIAPIGANGVKILGTFMSHGSQPILKTWALEASPYRVKVEYSEGQPAGMIVETPSGVLEFSKMPLAGGSVPLFYLRRFILETLANSRPIFPEMKKIVKGTIDDKKDAEALEALMRYFPGRMSSERPYAFAPIRTRPQRTYDPIKDVATPEGSHVPMILAGMVSRNPDAWRKLQRALDSFGVQSGLFSKVQVRRMGRNESDPFQIQVHVGGPAVNLVDVGYGVSQILPIIVDCVRGEAGGVFLLQQPEVHLHPRAQAELGSLLGVLAREQHKQFLVETHSDYLVDRLRMDIRDNRGLKPEDVSILYFERQNNEVQVHSMKINESGDLVDVPPGYRSFFLEEERRFLGG